MVSRPQRCIETFKLLHQTNGRLVFSTFGPSSLAELRGITRLASPVSLLSDTEWNNLIKQAGFTLSSSANESHRTFFPSTLELLKNLQQMGAAPTLMTNSRELRQLIKDYDQMYSTEQGVYANWELLYFSAINKQ